MKRFLIALLIIIVIAGAAGGCYYFFTRNTEDQGAAIACSPAKYYIKELRNGNYCYPGSTDLITLPYQDTSYCEFDDNFRLFRICFTSGTAPSEFDFVVTKISHKSRGRLTATLTQIYNGGLITYNLTTTKDEIILTATVTYQIMTATDDFQPTKVQYVTRDGVTAIAFSRIEPSYITGSGVTQ